MSLTDGSLPPSEASLSAAGSATLVERARHGDRDAVDRLLRMYLPRLRRWAHGRVPNWARNGSDTDDLVQDTVMDVLRNLGRFEYRQEGALQAYLRQAVLNRIRERFRRAERKPMPLALTDVHADTGPSPLEQAIGRQNVAKYESALLTLDAEDRELVIAKIEMGYSNDELAQLFGKPSKDAARVAAARALATLARAMQEPARG